MLRLGKESGVQTGLGGGGEHFVSIPNITVNMIQYCFGLLWDMLHAGQI